MRIKDKGENLVKKGHTFLGYRIIDGKAVINEHDAMKVRLIFKGYLSGLSYIDAAKAVGLQMCSSSVKLLMRNEHYLGDDYYPRIIDRNTFDAAETERQRRSAALNKKEGARGEPKFNAPKKFTLAKGLQKLSDPFEQASYVYSLIDIEE